MDEIIQLISILTPREVKFLRLRFSAKYCDSKRDVRGKLFRALKNGIVSNDNEAASLLYGKQPDAAYFQVKSRLKADIINVVLLMDVVDPEDGLIRAKFECRKLLLAGDLLLYRGKREIGVKYLKKASNMASDYELLGEHYIINSILQTHYGLRNGTKAYEKYRILNRSLIKMLQESQSANDLYRKITVSLIKEANSEHKYLNEAESALNDISKISKASDSVRVRFWYYRSAIFYYHLKKEYSIANAYGEKLLHLVLNNKSLKTKNNIAVTLMQLVRINIYLLNYEVAIDYSKKAIASFTKNTLNEEKAIETLFLAYLNKHSYTLSEIIIGQIKKHKQYLSNPFIKSKWTFYEAAYFFIASRFEDSYSLLNKIDILVNDKSGWRLGVKILELMCLIEMNDLDLLDSRLDVFRKNLLFVKRDNVNRPFLIYKAIKYYLKNAYSINPDNLMNNKAFKEIIISLESESWDPLGYEIIRFDDWVIRKIKLVYASKLLS